MLVYLDMCCLKRPFDDQRQARVRLESEAVLGLLAAEGQQLQFVRSQALNLENSRNPIRERASRVSQWLTKQDAAQLDMEALEKRSVELMRLGFKNFDALHIAAAEQVSVDVFATCDDRLLAAAKKNFEQIRVRVMSVLQLAQELLK